MVIFIINYVSTHLNFGDAFLFFSKQELSANFFSARYMTWTSRLLIEAMVVVLAKHHTIFLLITTCIIILMPFAIRGLVPQASFIHKHFWLIILVNSLYSMQQMNSAGWIATIVNYYYPLFVGMLALRLVSRSSRSPLEYVILNLSLVFACNIEQGCLILLLTFMYAFCFCESTQKRRRLALPLILCIASLFFILTTPGNDSRLAVEIYIWNPDFINFSMIYKAYLGFQSTVNHYFIDNSVIFLLLLITLSILGIINKKPMITIIATILIIYSFLPIKFHYIERINDATIEQNIVQYSVLSFSIFFFILLLFSLPAFFKNISKGREIVLIFFLGFLARFVLGLSPTLFASGTRTFIFTDFTIILVILLLINNQRSNTHKDNS